MALLALLFSAMACNGKVSPVPKLADARLELPVAEGSLRFAVIGDSGTGGTAQLDVARTMLHFHDAFPFELVLMLGDNLYGNEDPRDYEGKFAVPYRGLLDRGVEFYATLGNHDELSQRLYKHFNMDDERPYYSFRPDGHDVRFFAIYSDYLDPEQLEWLEKELSGSEERWKIGFFHHPIYSSGGRHGPDLALRGHLEPLFVRYGVDVVFAGHEHFYERIKPQKGILYFISGAAAKLRRGDILTTELTARGFDEDRHFILVEIVEDTMYYQAISRAGVTVDSGSFTDVEETDGANAGAPPRSAPSLGR